MTQSQRYRSRAGWYSVEYPGDWAVEESDDLVTFYRRETGVGALQLSAFRTPGQQDTREVLVEYLSDKDLPINRGSVSVEEQNLREVSTYHYIDGDSYRQFWVISQGPYLLFVTYNCKAVDKEKELDCVLSIIRSITIEKT